MPYIQLTKIMSLYIKVSIMPSKESYNNMSPLVRQMQQCHQHYFILTNYNPHHDHIIGIFFFIIILLCKYHM